MRGKPALMFAHGDGRDLFTPSDLDLLGTVATILDHRPIATWTDPRATDLLASAEVIVGHWGCPVVDAAVLDRAPQLGLFAHAAGSVKGIVDKVVFDRGIRVTTAAAANAEPVAEFTLAAILFAGKEVFWRRDTLRTPELLASSKASGTPVGNWDKTIGIVGASRVGRRVIELLAPFPQLAVAVYDPFVDDATAAVLGATPVGLHELCSTCDVVSLHAPSVPATRHMIAAPELAAMRTGTTLINTARGALVDHAALLAELRTGRLYAIVDVTDPEPLPPDHPLLSLPNAFVTPHLAGSLGTELHRLAARVTEEIRRWTAREPALDEVTFDQLDRIA